MNYLMPNAWKGFTAVAIIALLVLVAAIANGTHKFIRTASWILVGVVAVVASYNELRAAK